jgi:exopolysaccharide biosynthesis protein
MSKLPVYRFVKYVVFTIFSFALAAILLYQDLRINRAERKLSVIESSQSYFTQNFSESLFEDNLKVMNAMAVEGTISYLQTELDKIKALQTSNEKTVQDVYDSLTILEQKIQRNIGAKLKEPALSELKVKWGEYLLNKDFVSISSGISEQIGLLDTDYAAYLRKLEQTTVAATGYSYQTVDTERGRFTAYVIKVPLRDVRVKTVSASSNSCKDNCETKSLADYVKDSGGFAGMNGSYFCPPDYSSCSGKVNSTDFALYDSNEGKWEQKDALSWSKTGLITFNGTGVSFYKKSTDYGGGGVTAGISNYPSLLKDGEIVINDGDLSSYQKDVKGPRGVIGVGGENLYLVIVNGATTRDAAYVVRALGAKNALNLDGGGSSAMYVNGKYVVGPGRSLPNAIVLVK